jgi:hypothetical protein
MDRKTGQISFRYGEYFEAGVAYPRDEKKRGQWQCRGTDDHKAEALREVKRWLNVKRAATMAGVRN